MERTGWPLVPGVMIAVVALCVLPVLLGDEETTASQQGCGDIPAGLASQGKSYTMSDKPVAERLQVKGERRLAVIGARCRCGQG